jgi:exonuclease SbcD
LDVIAAADRDCSARAPGQRLARVLFLADTHLGFDLPFRPRVERRRRGHDFFRNTELALQPALTGEVDLVVHGGDLLYRSRVPPALVEMALAPLIEVAERGVPVYLVPGNHERSRIPVQLWSLHENLHLFDVPRTYLCPTPAGRIALAGFPFRRAARGHLRELVRQTRCDEAEADARLLCMHQVVEGSVVGAQSYTFRSGPEVIAGSEVPAGFAVVLSGHIHRAQTLTHDLQRRRLATPVIYAGAVERTSFAERLETKSYAVVTLSLAGDGRLVHVEAIPLPARPMVDLVLDQAELGDAPLTPYLRSRIAALDPDAVVRVHLRGATDWEARRAVTAPYLRSLAPESMNISLAILRPRE